MDTAGTVEVRSEIRIEIITVIRMTIEMAVSIVAGIAAGSILLIAFGIDSLIELISSGILLWRLGVESRGGDVEQVKQAEHKAAWVVTIALVLLCAYVLISAIYGLIVRTKPESSVLGIRISVVAVLVMPYLAMIKRRISNLIQNRAFIWKVNCGETKSPALPWRFLLL